MKMEMWADTQGKALPLFYYLFSHYTTYIERLPFCLHLDWQGHGISLYESLCHVILSNNLCYPISTHH